MATSHTVILRNGLVATIRRAREADAETLLANVNEIGAEGVYIHTERLENSLDQERAWIAAFDGRTSVLLVPEIDGRVVGQADVRRGQQVKNAHVAQLGIALRKEVRGLGLGKALMDASIDWARSIGIRKLCLTVFGTNRRAIALYQRVGFEEEARLKGQVILQGVPVDEVLMARWL